MEETKHAQRFAKIDQQEEKDAENGGQKDRRRLRNDPCP